MPSPLRKVTLSLTRPVSRFGRRQASAAAPVASAGSSTAASATSGSGSKVPGLVAALGLGADVAGGQGVVEGHRVRVGRVTVAARYLTRMRSRNSLRL